MIGKFKPSILKLPNYSRLYWAGSTSELGSFVTETVLALFLFEITNQNKSYLGLLRAVFLIFLTIGGILGGPIGERFNRKSILLFCEVIRIPGVIILIFFQKIWTLLIIEGFLAFFTGIFKPNRQALVNEIVPPKDMKKANALFGSTNAIIHLLGPFLGALIFAQLKGISEILTFDLLTYVIGFYLLSKINYQAPVKENKTKSHFFGELKEGLQYVKAHIELKAIMYNAIIAGLCIGILIPMVIPFTVEILGKTETEYGYLMASFGLGGFLGGILSTHLTQKIPAGRVAILAILGEVILFASWIRTHFLLGSLILIFIWGMLVFIRITSQLNFVSEKVPTSYLTRVYSLLEMSFITPNILGSLLVGIIGNKYATMDILVIASWSFIILIALRLLFRDFWALWKSSHSQVSRDTQVD